MFCLGFRNPCLVNNGGCQDICGLDARGSVVCSCYLGRNLVSGGDSNGTQCIGQSMSCSEDSFHCVNGGCIPHTFTCDGINHCPDHSDENEKYCATRPCKPGHFHCNNNHCIYENQTCDQVNDCGDGSDELNCTCPQDHFRCGKKQAGPCILSHFRCDNDPDCPDASDEMGCPPQNCSVTLHHINTSDSLVKCQHTTACIHANWICDGENDCWDGSDELNCGSLASECAFVP
ncbi:hypothetical protein J437_LFUL001044 [Ladona fulva]|uniref:Uncharacterized protein n=1 Tax=Ladona fulva TaxID=123851 RepID=A0A8K0KFY8_LADFU|nr:hypothetical protein J437_LFUL001044 [Ladona fulva]